jgi:hypothetical protein
MNYAQLFHLNVESTEDCLSFIDPFKKFNFKRKSKFNINVDNEQHVVRVFEDKKTQQAYTIISNGNEVKLMNIDLTLHKETIKKIQENAKYIYTCDYGGVWFNPKTMSVWVSGGDGGIGRWEGSPKKLAKIIEDSDFPEDNEPKLAFDKIDGIKEVFIEAECSPVNDKWEEDIEYIMVANCKDLSEYMDY